MRKVHPASTLVYPILLTCALAIALFSCAPSTSSNEVPNALIAQPDTLHMSGLAATANTTLALRCGCSFSMTDSTWGDTAYVRITHVDANVDMLSNHRIAFSVAPSAPKGNYTAYFRFATWDAASKSNFYATVVVTLVVP